MAFKQVQNTRELHDLPGSTRIKVNGKEKTIGDYAGLVTGGVPILDAMAMLGQSIQIWYHEHNDGCPTLNGHPTHSPEHCPNREDI